MINAKNIIRIVRQGEALKSVERAGWSLAGVSGVRVESVGEHSYGTALLSIVIAKSLIERNDIVDSGKVASRALIHDLPEAITSDIPYTITKNGGEKARKAKRDAEREAITSISLNGFGNWIVDLWREMETRDSLESRIVAGADILDMLLHAIELERSGTSPEKLDQFFVTSQQRINDLNITIVKDIFWELYREHSETAEKIGISIQEISRIE
ncbi:MAG: HD family hydrolase [Candidatus Thorarchaeota archaeon]